MRVWRSLRVAFMLFLDRIDRILQDLFLFLILLILSKYNRERCYLTAFVQNIPNPVIVINQFFTLFSTPSCLLLFFLDRIDRILQDLFFCF